MNTLRERIKSFFKKSASKITETQRRDERIKLRAAERIGQLSRELEKAKYDKGHGTVVPRGGNYKGEQLKAAGISTSAANRYEDLAPSIE